MKELIKYVKDLLRKSNIFKMYKHSKSVSFLHDFWKNPDELNNPNDYLKPIERSEYLLSLIKRIPISDPSIIEYGCNSGRNLNYLYQKGYKKLTGVEINREAINVLRRNFPDLLNNITLYSLSMEDFIYAVDYDISFTMAVLEHIHTDSEFIFERIVKTSKYIITIEDENSLSYRHFPRNYNKIFTKLGCTQIFRESNPVPFGEGFVTRIFST